jgi:hypothetical protein
MRRTLVLLALLGLLVLCGYAQNLEKAKISFSFVVDGKTLPAGTYTFRELSPKVMEIRNVDTSEAVLAPIITRIGMVGSVTEPSLTFDEVGDKLILETVWPPAGDGFLLATTKEKHTHRKVKI